jgi:DNA-binding CsgD family transcriptional regulator
MNRPDFSMPVLPDVELYEIDIRAGHFGQLRYRWPGAGEEWTGRQHCYAARYGAPGPCPGCPVEDLGPGCRRATRVVSVGAGRYDIATAQYVDARSARVAVHRIDEPVLSQLLQARVARYAAEARLSRREGAVLTYLLMGRSMAEIGEILGISPRTVKFHQANLLEKLGADSRLDLMRLLL